MPADDRIHIGTSGWSYEHWLGPFYPQELGSARMLAYYADRFRTVEINNSFYHLPSEKSLRGWGGTVGEDFIFAVKASRYITHMKKLKDPEIPVTTFLERIETLGPRRLGPILIQLPPKWRCNTDRLRHFLDYLPKAHRYAFEFRNPSWFIEEVYDLLMGAGAAFCIYEIGGLLSPKAVTADFVYIRLHGPDGAYQGSYPAETLADWAAAIAAWVAEGKEVFCYFDNDQLGFAAQNAAQLQEMVS